MNMRKSGLLLLLLLCSHIAMQGQVIVTVPEFPTDLDSTVVIFDATKGNAGLMNASPPIYAHTGVITNLSPSTTDWRYVVAPWTTNLPKALMTPLGNNLYQLILKPSIREYYGVPASETIEKIAFVFRNSDGTATGREADGSDIFGDVYPVTLSIHISSPAQKDLFVKQNSSIPVVSTSPLADSMFLYVNSTFRKKVKGLTISDTIVADNFGHDWTKYFVRIVAKNDTASVADSFSYTVIPDPTVADLPSGISDGINYINDSTVILSLFAPYKDFCFVTGDFNDWQPAENGYMNKTPDSSRYWIEIDHLIPGKENIYQYLVDGSLAIGDPYADKVSDPDDQYISSATYPDLIPYPAGQANGIATVLQTAQVPYSWDTTTFNPPKITDLVIYELLIRDFTASHTYQSVMDTLDYLKKLGINAIELMPVMEFEGNISWGYNPDYMFAPDKYYGPKNSLKDLVQVAHRKGIAVILDIVLNHQFGKSPLAKLYWNNANNRPASNSPWFNPIPRHPYNVGNDFNHESPFTKAFCDRAIRYWIMEYHVDGYRFDLSKGFTQVNSYPDNMTLWNAYDDSRILILKHYYSTLRSAKVDTYMILEHFADNSEEKNLSTSGMLLWGNMNYNYNEATMGWLTNSNFSGISYQQRGWTKPNLVGYMESHDEERLAYKDVTWGNSLAGYNIQDTTTSLKRLELAACFFFTVPGPKMIWQFGELGYDYSINWPTETSDSRLAPKPVRWDYLDQWRRSYTKNIFSSLISLKKNQPVFSSGSFLLDVGGAAKRIWLRDSTMDVTVLGNFDVAGMQVIPAFTREGEWYEYFTGDSLVVSDTLSPLYFNPGEYRLYTTVKLPKPLFTGISDATPKEDGEGILVYPNPSDGEMTFLFDLPQTSIVSVKIFDVFSRMLLNFNTGILHQGKNAIKVNLNDNVPGKIPDGIFLFRADAENYHKTGKLVIRSER
jgi:1,4-alpha-glucan branching enzyme